MNKLKKLLLLCLLLPLTKINAYSYSSWTTDYPNVENAIIEEEQRYLYYELKEENIEYLKYEETLNTPKQVDYNVFNYSDEYETDILPDNLDNIEYIDNSYIGEIKYTNASYIIIKNEMEFQDLNIEYVSLTDTKNSLNIPYEVSTDGTIYNDTSYYLKPYESVKLDLKNSFEVENILISLCIRRSEEETDEKLLDIYFYDENDNLTFEIMRDIEYDYNLINFYDLQIHSNEYSSFIFTYEGLINSYLIKDKLYKCYDLVREDIGYYKTLEGNYYHDDEPVTFYRYKLKEEEKETIEIKEEEQNKTPKKEKKTKTEPIKVEYDYEYLETYPLDTKTEIDEYKVYDNEDKTEPKNNEYLSALINDPIEKEEKNYFKIFTIISSILVIILIIILIIIKIYKTQKKH